MAFQAGFGGMKSRPLLPPDGHVQPPSEKWHLSPCKRPMGLNGFIIINDHPFANPDAEAESGCNKTTVHVITNSVISFLISLVDSMASFMAAILSVLAFSFTSDHSCSGTCVNMLGYSRAVYFHFWLFHPHSRLCPV